MIGLETLFFDRSNSVEESNQEYRYAAKSSAYVAPKDPHPAKPDKPPATACAKTSLEKGRRRSLCSLSEQMAVKGEPMMEEANLPKWESARPYRDSGSDRGSRNSPTPFRSWNDKNKPKGSLSFLKKDNPRSDIADKKEVKVGFDVFRKILLSPAGGGGAIFCPCFLSTISPESLVEAIQVLQAVR